MHLLRGFPKCQCFRKHKGTFWAHLHFFLNLKIAMKMLKMLKVYETTFFDTDSFPTCMFKHS